MRKYSFAVISYNGYFWTPRTLKLTDMNSVVTEEKFSEFEVTDSKLILYRAHGSSGGGVEDHTVQRILTLDQIDELIVKDRDDYLESLVER